MASSTIQGPTGEDRGEAAQPPHRDRTHFLYVAVIGVFVGELTGLLLSAESAFPL